MQRGSLGSFGALGTSARSNSGRKPLELEPSKKRDSVVKSEKERGTSSSPAAPESSLPVEELPVDDVVAVAASNANVERPANDGSVSKDTLRRIQSIVEEFYVNGLLAEAVLNFRSIMHPDVMGEGLKSLLVTAMDQKEESRSKLSKLLVALVEDNFLTSAMAVVGVTSFLDSFDDICIDAPKAVLEPIVYKLVDALIFILCYSRTTRLQSSDSFFSLAQFHLVSSHRSPTPAPSTTVRECPNLSFGVSQRCAPLNRGLPRQRRLFKVWMDSLSFC